MRDADEVKMMSDWLANWASERELIFKAESTCGFGRPCVGITDGTSYVELGPSEIAYGVEYPVPVEGSHAPKGVNAYHKHDCLAVLVDDDDYDSGVEQLFRWIQSIDQAGLVVKKVARRSGSVIEALINGTTMCYLDLPDGES